MLIKSEPIILGYDFISVLDWDSKSVFFFFFNIYILLILVYNSLENSLSWSTTKIFWLKVAIIYKSKIAHDAASCHTFPTHFGTLRIKIVLLINVYPKNLSPSSAFILKPT